MAWFGKFAAACFALVGLATAGAWALWGFAPQEIGLNGMIALGLGVLLTAALGVGLMALVFASARRGDPGGPRK